MSGYRPGDFGRNSHVPAVRNPFLKPNHQSELTTQESALNVERAKPRYTAFSSILIANCHPNSLSARKRNRVRHASVTTGNVCIHRRCPGHRSRASKMSNSFILLVVEYLDQVTDGL